MISALEIKRKIVHLATLIVPLGYALTSEQMVLFFLVPFFLCYLLVDLLRHFVPSLSALFQKYLFGRVLREEEGTGLMGSTYFLFSTILTILLFPKSIAISSLLILILADTAAALVGKGLGKVRILEKTLEGGLAFFFTALVIVWTYPGIDRCSGSLAAAAATLVEILPIRLNDNLTIPLTAGTIMFFLGG